MKKLLVMLAMVGLTATSTAHAEDKILKICKGQFAFCGASSTTPTGKTMLVNGKKFRQGVAVCPVMDGPAIANMELMKNSCNSPDGTKKTVWSLFWYYDAVPQAPTWESLPTVNRKFVTTKTPGGGMSNMWAFPCVVEPEKVNGATLSKCYGPLNENPFPLRKGPLRVRTGKTVITQAPLGAPYPVGAIFPVTDDQVKADSK
jgi:hypothetical protein